MTWQCERLIPRMKTDRRGRRWCQFLNYDGTVAFELLVTGDSSWLDAEAELRKLAPDLAHDVAWPRLAVAA